MSALLIKGAEPDDLYSLLAEQLQPRLRLILETSGPKQRLRVTTLPEPVMERLAEALQDPRWGVFVLSEEPSCPWEATSGKLIELRDKFEPPFLAFLPPGPRTASEDSLDIATFTELSLTALPNELSNTLLERIGEPLRSSIRELLARLVEVRQMGNQDEQIEYLLTVLKNGGTAEAAGGALYVFGLVPDFALFTREGANLHMWLSMNQRVCDRLGEVNQPLQNRLRSLKLKPETLQNDLYSFFRSRHIDEPRKWARAIGCDRLYRGLSLDNWEFADAPTAEELRLVLDTLSLPRQTIDEVGNSEPLRILNLLGGEPLKVAFRSIPSPNHAPAWKTWRVQILAISESGAAVAWESNSFPKPASGRQAKVRRSIKLADLQALDEGAYFVRVDAYDANGTQLTTVTRVDSKDPHSRAENESEPFLLVRDEDVSIEELEVRATFAPSLLAAWVRATVKALDSRLREPAPSRNDVTGAWTQPVGASVKGEARFELSSEGFIGFAVVVPSLLRKIELTILEYPRKLGLYFLSLAEADSPGQAEIQFREPIELPGGPETDTFLVAREKVFSAILNRHIQVEDTEEAKSVKRGIVEVIDLIGLEATVADYVRAYCVLAQSLRADVLRALAWLDVVELRWRPGPGDPGRALLLGPTHPLRMLWHMQHTGMLDDAIRSWEERSEQVPDWRRFIERLRDDLLPLNQPMVLFDRRGRAYSETLPISSFWGLFLPDRDERWGQVDTVAARDHILAAMGMQAPSISVTTVDPSDLAERAFEYVLQHPYVDQLRMNVFNPGDGRLVADVLRAVEKLRRERLMPSPPSLRYAIHLFAPVGQVDSMGEAIENLLDPDRHVGEDDEFTLSTGNHLHPKLICARNDILEFLRDPGRFPAHLSLLVEQFTAQGRIGPLDLYRRGSFVRGLVQEPETVVLDRRESDSPVTGWTKGLRPVARNHATAGERLLVQALAAAQHVQASFALGRPAEEGVAPVIALQLDVMAQALLKQVHEVSDRVLTVDRHLGIDYFDSPSAGHEAGYLIDYTPEFLQEDRQRILLTTRSTLELERMLGPMLASYGLKLQPGDELMVLETLRSLSGRLALRLEGAGTRAAEVIGLLLARWLLEEAEVLRERIIIPVDAHRGWFLRDQSQRRADLLLIGFQAPDTVRIDVVEVKLREQLPVAARESLYRGMHEQTENTEKRLRELFDPDLYPTPRADQALQAKELAGILGFYVRRASRYGLLSNMATSDALSFLERLDEGYRLDVRRLGVVFEHHGTGSHIDEDEPGFAVHRFGGDKARALFEAAMGRYEARESLRSERGEPSLRTQGTEALSVNQSESLHPRTPLADDLDSLRSTLDVQPPRPTEQPIPPVTQKLDEIPDSRPVNGPPPQEIPTADKEAEVASNEVGEPQELAGTSSLGEVETQEADAEEEALSVDAASSEHDPKAVVQRPDIIIGASEATPQYGILGKTGSHTVALDLNGCNTISLFGVQGFGKSYTLGVIAEMATMQCNGVNALPFPLATVIFHYHKSDAYEPEYASAISPNRKLSEIDRLLAEYGARPQGLQDVVLLAPEARVEQRRRDYPDIVVEPIKFSAAELGAESWKFLLGAYGNDSLYLRQLVAIMRRHRSGLTLQMIREEMQDAELTKAAQRLADDRLNLAEPYIDDSRPLGGLLQPGRTVIVDLRDEWIEKEEALGLFVVMLRIFAATKYQGKMFNKLVVFDEAHKYITESDLIGQVVETIREMRHQATSVVVASQDPMSVPRTVIELTSILVMHRITSPAWLKYLKTAIAALGDVVESQVTSLMPGEALVWAQRSNDRRFVQRPHKIQIRPRLTQHGGGTKTAVDGVTLR